MQSIHALKQLYELDDSQWLGETISLLRNHQFQQLDLEHLIEELEDLGKEEEIYNFRTQLKREMTTNLRNYLEEIPR